MIFLPIRPAATESEGYERPIDWLTLPDEEDGFFGIKAVTDDESNYLTLYAEGDYVVDWGDGIIENFSSGVTAEHLYNYDDLSEASYCSRGYRQAIVKLKAQPGHDITAIDLQRTHSAVPVLELEATFESGWLEIRASYPNLATFKVNQQNRNVGIHMLEIFTLGANSITDLSYMFSYCTSLQSLPSIDVSSGTSFYRMFRNCYQLVQIPVINAPACTDFREMFYYCTRLKTAQFSDTSSGGNFSGLFDTCYQLETVTGLDTSNATDVSRLFRWCYSLKTLPNIDVGNVTTFASMCDGCRSLESVPDLDTSSGQDFGQMFSGCYNLTEVPLFDTSQGTSFYSMFRVCISLITVPNFNTSNGLTFSFMFYGCRSLTSIPPLDASKGTVFTSFAGECYSLTKCEMTGMTKAIGFVNSKLPTTSIVEIFENLGTVIVATVIDVRGNFGTSSLTPEQRAIATGKGWTVTYV